MTEFDYDAIRDLYEADLDSAVSFSGRDHEFFMRAKARVILDTTRRRLGEPAGLAALDIGCGVGLLDRHIAGAFGSLTGTDVFPQTLEDAAAASPDVRYVLSDGKRLPFADGEFDLVFTTSVIQVLEPTAVPAFVSELARVVRPGGLAIAIEHNPLNPLTRFVVKRAATGTDVTALIGRRRLTRLLEAAGLVIDERGYILLTPSEAAPALTVERALRALPLGAQHYVAGRRV